mmetsp:Transcript_89111/g.155874  ORF Transcript_89111/g.155874 Transcript_89111/m.155874 type:complete len:223 (+) Transcript_89111:354-1022(+)
MALCAPSTGLGELSALAVLPSSRVLSAALGRLAGCPEMRRSTEVASRCSSSRAYSLSSGQPLPCGAGWLLHGDFDRRGAGGLLHGSCVATSTELGNAGAAEAWSGWPGCCSGAEGSAGPASAAGKAFAVGFARVLSVKELAAAAASETAAFAATLTSACRLARSSAARESSRSLSATCASALSSPTQCARPIPTRPTLRPRSAPASAPCETCSSGGRCSMAV